MTRREQQQQLRAQVEAAVELLELIEDTSAENGPLRGALNMYLTRWRRKLAALEVEAELAGGGDGQ